MTVDLWHDLSAGPQVPEVIHALIEIPKGSRNKYEYSKEDRVLKLDRVLYSSIHYPGDYGFVPKTYFDDNDPLDVLVILNQPTFPGCLIEVRPIGMLKIVDRGEPDFKILAVVKADPTYSAYHDLKDVPHHYLVEVEHFFTTYKQLEGAVVDDLGWANVVEAKATIETARRRYDAEFAKTD
jgi:inorganic pyrophosphatase